MVAISCEAIQTQLAEVGGDTGQLNDEVRLHLERCPECCEVAAGERALGLIFANALPAADPGMEHRVRRAMRSVRRRRRVVALLPVAASLFVALLGAVLLGGLPGGSLLALLPVWSSQGWVSLAATASDWTAALSTAAGATEAVLSPAVIGVALAVSVLGVTGMVVATRRWRRISPWRNVD
jgi:hypothetical protein